MSLFFMDYPHKARLKLLGRANVSAATIPSATTSCSRVTALIPERGLLITVEAFDWNCSQHITPRFTLPEIDAATAPLRARIDELEAALKARG